MLQQMNFLAKRLSPFHCTKSLRFLQPRRFYSDDSSSTHSSESHTSSFINTFGVDSDNSSSGHPQIVAPRKLEPPILVLDPNPSSGNAMMKNNPNETTASDILANPNIKIRKPVVTLEDIQDAYTRVQPLLKPSPLLPSPRLTADLAKSSVAKFQDSQLFFKFENKHLTGSFKERGAINKLAKLTPEERKNGVVAASAGNHAQAVSFYSKRLGIDAKIVMPELTPLAKVSGTADYGAKVVLFGESLDDSYQEALRIQKEEGRTLVHPFNDYDIIAGQGTMGLEIIEQNPYLDAVVIPIGGGGLISGTSVAMKTVNPKIKIYGVQTTAVPGMKKSLEMRRVQKVPYNNTIADGIAVKTVGELTYEVVKDYVDEVVMVTDDEIAGAVMMLLEKEKTMVEGAGAAAFAALMYGKLEFKNKKVCVCLSGGNIDVSVLRGIIDRGLVQTGRMARMRILVPDVPGQLAAALTLLAQLKCNVKEVQHERAFRSVPPNFTLISLTIQTKGLDHIEQVKQTMQEKNYVFSVEE